METPGLLSRIRHLNNNNDETTRLKLTENIDLKLYYPKNKEYDVKKFINNTIDDLYDVIDAIPISNDTTVIIHINETGKVPIYNTKPYGGESSRTESYLSTKKHDILSYAPVRPPLQERRRMSEANHSLSKCGDIRAQIHIGPSQSVSHYFFVPRLDLYR